MNTCNTCIRSLSACVKKSLWLNAKKCEFGRSRVKYLGHVVENGTVCANPDKVAAVRTWPKPTNVKEVQQFIGLANYYA